jgi:outer membrane protein assembly factor BamD
MFKKNSAVVVLFLIVLGFMAGCGSRVVNLREMTPEEQFEYAKKFYDKGDYDKAKIQLTMVALNNAGSPISDKIQYYLADTEFQLKTYIEAAAEFEKLIRSLPQSPFADDARYKVGMCYYKLAPGYALDQEYTHKAITQFEQFIDEYPASELRPEAEKRLHECREKLAKKEFKTGELYQKMGYFRAAAISYDNVTKEFATSSFCEEAFYRKGECHLKMGELDQAQEAFETLTRKLSSGSFAEKADTKLKEIREKREKAAGKS